MSTLLATTMFDHGWSDLVISGSGERHGSQRKIYNRLSTPASRFCMGPLQRVKLNIFNEKLVGSVLATGDFKHQQKIRLLRLRSLGSSPPWGIHFGVPLGGLNIEEGRPTSYTTDCLNKYHKWRH